MQLNNSSDIEDLIFLISNGFISSNLYDKRDDFDFDIVNFRFLDPRDVYISQHSVC